MGSLWGEQLLGSDSFDSTKLDEMTAEVAEEIEREKEDFGPNQQAHEGGEFGHAEPEKGPVRRMAIHQGVQGCERRAVN